MSVAAVTRAEEEDEEMKNIFLSTNRRHHSTIHAPHFDGLSMNDMKHLQARLAYQQQQQQLQPQLEPQFRETPNSAGMKRCASACAVGPNLSPLGPGLTSPPPRLTPALAGTGSGVGVGWYDGCYSRDGCFSTPPPPPLGRQSVSKSECASNHAFMTTPDGHLRDFASRIRDSPIAHVSFMPRTYLG